MQMSNGVVLSIGIRCVIRLSHNYFLIAELRRAKRASGAPWVRKFGNLSMREILVMTSAYAHPRVQTLGEGEWSPKAARPGVGEENRL